MMKCDVAVIGGGPSGLIAAAVAALKGNEVILIERNKLLGRKLRITGKGRCNITNSCEIEDFIRNVPSNGSFLYSSFYSFTNDDVIELFNKLGVKTKIERGGRVFPVSDKASDVADALVRYAKNAGVIIKSGVKATTITSDESHITGVLTNSEVEISCPAVILACGGLSYPKTGSDGDGYRFAKQLGHTVTPLKPSLVPLVAKEAWVKDLSGLTLKNVAVNVKNTDGKNMYSDFGEMIFTHFGVSGPVILSASSHIRNFNNENYVLTIDLKPALSQEQLDKRLQRDFEKYINKNFSNALNDLLPKSLISTVIQLSDIDSNKKIHQITKEERIRIIDIIKRFTLTIINSRPIDEAIITSGGIATTEINPSTMESRLVKGLYFAGEMIDVDGYTGGYNLQIAFSTGWLAGNSV